jgi:hypothetical protein
VVSFHDAEVAARRHRGSEVNLYAFCGRDLGEYVHTEVTYRVLTLACLLLNLHVGIFIGN